LVKKFDLFRQLLQFQRWDKRELLFHWKTFLGCTLFWGQTKSGEKKRRKKKLMSHSKTKEYDQIGLTEKKKTLNRFNINCFHASWEKQFHEVAGGFSFSINILFNSFPSSICSTPFPFIFIFIYFLSYYFFKRNKRK